MVVVRKTLDFGCGIVGRADRRFAINAARQVVNADQSGRQHHVPASRRGRILSVQIAIRAVACVANRPRAANVGALCATKLKLGPTRLSSDAAEFGAASM